MYLFEQGYPRYLLVYAITGMQDLYPQVRPHLNVAWHIDRKWQHHEPGFCRAVLPAVAIRAVLCLGALWKWRPFVGLVLLGFAGMLRPNEMVQLVRRDLIFPRDLAYDMSCMFIYLQNPKTSRFARRQHCRIDDEAIIMIAEHLFAGLPLDQRLFPHTLATFRRQWNSVLTRLGIPHRQN